MSSPFEVLAELQMADNKARRRDGYVEHLVDAYAPAGEERRPDPSWLLDTYEVARLLGVSTARVGQLAQEDPRFPAPLRTFRRYRVYWRPDVEVYGRIPRPNYLRRRVDG